MLVPNLTDHVFFVPVEPSDPPFCDGSDLADGDPALSQWPVVDDLLHVSGEVDFSARINDPVVETDKVILSVEEGELSDAVLRLLVEFRVVVVQLQQLLVRDGGQLVHEAVRVTFIKGQVWAVQGLGAGLADFLLRLFLGLFRGGSI